MLTIRDNGPAPSLGSTTTMIAGGLGGALIAAGALSKVAPMRGMPAAVAALGGAFGGALAAHKAIEVIAGLGVPGTAAEMGGGFATSFALAGAATLASKIGGGIGGVLLAGLGGAAAGAFAATLANMLHDNRSKVHVVDPMLKHLQRPPQEAPAPAPDRPLVFA